MSKKTQSLNSAQHFFKASGPGTSVMRRPGQYRHLGSTTLDTQMEHLLAEEHRLTNTIFIFLKQGNPTTPSPHGIQGFRFDAWTYLFAELCHQISAHHVWSRRSISLKQSSSTRSPYWNMNSLVMVLRGLRIQLLCFIGKKQGAEYAWMKQDSAIPDPNCNSYKSERNRFMRFTNAIAHKGKFYALSLRGTLGVIEDIESQPRITALGPKRAIPSVYSSHFKECLLESDGDILLIFLISRKSVNIVDDVEVFRLDVNTLSWIKIGRLGGDSALFLGSNCCMSVSASKMGCKSDCVYFSHHREDDWWVYDLQRGSISLCRSHEISHKICR
ncbi:putative F-box protein [Citrus sinensis]|uniref:F-box protein n=1 Tax=Citrus sinensis TaxID=2711 RepID=A0ACB8IIW3_CITSI|nr:putative F-box protein [Citrus sinensis]